MKSSILIILMAFLTAPAWAQAQKGAEKEVAAAVEALRAAMVNADRTALENLTADALSYGHSSGKVENRASFIENLAGGQSDFVSITLTEQQISISDNTALVRTTYAGKRIVVLIPYQTVEQFTTLNQTLEKDKQYQTAGRDYIDAPYTTPPYSRIETILLQAFADAPVMTLPALKGAQPDRVYELRSYEGHTEKISQNKIHMFNEGGEIKLFQRLNFNAVFYAEVLAGANRPNFMYMTSFDNRASREEHWKTFTEDAEWKKLLAAPEYKNNMLKNTQYLLNAAAYSDI